VKRQLKIDRHYNGREEAQTANTGLAKVAQVAIFTTNVYV